MKMRVPTSPFGLAVAAGTVMALTAATMALPPALLKDLDPAAADTTAGSFPQFPYQLANNVVLFYATDPVNGAELWRTDGTAAGTFLVKDLAAGADESWIRVNIGTAIVAKTQYAPANGGKAYFWAQSNSVAGELHITDGTAAGTNFITDLAPGSSYGVGAIFGDNELELDISLVSIGGQAYYTGDNITNGAEFFTTDGITTSLIADMQAGVNDGAAHFFTVVGNKIAFVATDGTASGYEMYVYDTTQPINWNPGGNNKLGNPKRMSDLNGTADGAYEFMRSVAAGNFVYFMATDAGGVSNNLWRFDISATNPALDQTNTAAVTTDRLTVQATQISPTVNTARVQFTPTVVTGGGQTRVFWIANGGDNLNTRLWAHNPAGTMPNQQAVSQTGIFPRRGTVLGSKLLYAANSGSYGSATTNQTAYPGGAAAAPKRGYELYALDVATQTGLFGGNQDFMIRDLNPGPASGLGMVLPTQATGQSLPQGFLFPTYMYAKNGKVWYNGTAIGNNFLPLGGTNGNGTVYPTGYTAANDTGGAAQLADAATTAVQPYLSDGTLAGTPNTPILFMNPLGGPQTPGANAFLFEVEKLNNTQVVFSGFTPASGRELWKSDGTGAGTVIVADIAADFSDSFPALWTSMPETQGDPTLASRDTRLYQNRIFFNAFTPTSGRELWTAVGVPFTGTSASSTTQVAEINTTAGSGSNPAYLTPVQMIDGTWRLFFGATTTPVGSTTVGSGFEPYSLTMTTDGFPNPPAQIADLNPGVANGFAAFTNNNLSLAGVTMGQINGEYVFIGNNGTSGRELFRTDGTAAPTLIADLNPGTGTTGPNPALGFMADNTTNVFATFPELIQLSGNRMAFAGVDGVSSQDLAASTTQGVGEPYLLKSDFTYQLLNDLNPGTGAGSGASDFAEVPVTANHPQGALLFFADDGTLGKEPYIYDFASNTVSLLAGTDINGTAFNAASYVGVGFTIAGDWAVFSATDGVNGNEVYMYNFVTDTLQGAFNNAALNLNTGALGAASSFPGPYYALPSFTGGVSKICFDANNGVNGFELWELDVTQPLAAGVNPKLVVDLNPGSADGVTGEFSIGGDTILGANTMGSWLYFAGNNGTQGIEPYRYNGLNNIIGTYPDATGIEQLADIYPGLLGSEPTDFFADSTVFAQITYFNAFKPADTAPLGANGNEPHFFVAKCGPADISKVGGIYPSGDKLDYWPADGQVGVDDLIVFINAFSEGCGANIDPRCNPADITGVGGPVDASTFEIIPPDGQLTSDDLILFVNAFSDGCE